jgi:phosphoketolase
MRALFRQFSFPGGIPSHVAPETPGSIHEGGELGYALTHAYGAAFDNPDLVVYCMVGDGEGRDGSARRELALEQVPEPARDGAVLPVLQLNGYKIANPTVLARIPEDELCALLEGYGHAPRFVSGDDPERGDCSAPTMPSSRSTSMTRRASSWTPRRWQRRSSSSGTRTPSHIAWSRAAAVARPRGSTRRSRTSWGR